MTLKQLETKYNVLVTPQQSKYGFCGKVEKVIKKITETSFGPIYSTSYKTLFEFDTFSKKDFVEKAIKELEKEDTK